MDRKHSNKTVQTLTSQQNKSKIQLRHLLSHIIPEKQNFPLKNMVETPHLIEWMFQLLSITTPLASRMLATVTPVIDIVPEVTNMTLEKQP